MRRLISLLSTLTVLAAVAGGLQAAEPAAEKKVRVLVTFGGHGFQQEPFFAMFDAMPNVTYTKAPMPKSAELLKPGLEKDYDVIVMYDMVGKITPEQQNAFIALLNEGIGVVSLHHNLGAHRDWSEFRKIIGGKFHFKEETIEGVKCSRSTWSHGEDLKVAVADKEHPTTKGLKDFEIHDETYGKYYTAPDVKVLLTTDHPKNDPELAWVLEYGKSRVFYFMLGHDNQAWKNPNYPEIVLRAIRWTAGQ